MGMDGKAAHEEEPAFDMSAQQAPSTPANDMIGARSENSVLFSLSALQAVGAPAASSPSADSSSGGAGFIDVKALAASSPAPRRRTTEAAPQVSYAPMNTVMPLGTKKNNTVFIVLGVATGVALVVVIVYWGIGARINGGVFAHAYCSCSADAHHDRHKVDRKSVV